MQPDTILPIPPPPLSLPPSNNTVTLQAIDTTLQLYVRSENFLEPIIPGHEIYNCPTMSFLITPHFTPAVEILETTQAHTPRRILFDAGGRKDYWNYSPLVAGRFQKGVNVKGLRCEMGVHEILENGCVGLEEIEAVVWSHWHFDHIGDMSKFPSSADIVVGPGFKENLLPGYPSNPESALLETDYNTHVVREINFSPDFKIGQFEAFDYFNNGSFYLLNVPGHAIGHMCALARTTPTSFVLLGADTCHFAGSLRPSPYIPLPQTLDAMTSGLDACFPSACPCTMFGDCHPSHSTTEKRTKAYYRASRAPGSAYLNPDLADESISSMKEFDASPNVFVCLAHDPGLFDVLPLFNQNSGYIINDWREKGYKEATRWRFLNELPREGKPGREPIVYGYWRDGKQVSAVEAMTK